MGQLDGGLGRSYLYSRHGQMWVATPANPSTGTFTGQTSFVATTPTFLIYKASATTRTVLKGFRLSQVGTVAGGDISVAIVVDPDNRFSAGGTTIPQVQRAVRQDNTSSFTVLANPTATATDSDERTVESLSMAASLGNILDYDAESELMIAGTGSILIYTWAAVTGPTWKPVFELYEEAL